MGVWVCVWMDLYGVCWLERCVCLCARNGKRECLSPCACVQDCGVGTKVLISYSAKAAMLYHGVVVAVRRSHTAPVVEATTTATTKRTRGGSVLASQLMGFEFLVHFDGWSDKENEWRSAADVVAVYV